MGCPMSGTIANTGVLSASLADMCNVSGSMGAQHWYRIAGVLPTGTANYVQLELWDNTGVFAGGTVHTGTFPITGVETDYNTCGVCVRGVGDKGGTTSKEYFGTSGSVTVTAFGPAPDAFQASVDNIGFVEVDTTMHAPVTGGCTATVAHSARSMARRPTSAPAAPEPVAVAVAVAAVAAAVAAAAAAAA